MPRLAFSSSVTFFSLSPRCLLVTLFIFALNFLCIGETFAQENVWVNDQTAWSPPGLTSEIESPQIPCVLRGQPIQLFDGKTLNGWAKSDGSNSKNWIVEDGLLTRPKRGGDLYHEHWFKDFELSFTWKISANANSGVKYRVQDYDGKSLGCEYQIQDDKGKPLTKLSTGSLYAVYEPSSIKKVNPLGQWNDSKIVVCGNRIEHWLNGQLIVTTFSGDTDWLNRVANSKFSDKWGFGQNREGRIFLQDHGHPVWFKNLELIPLSCDVAPQMFMPGVSLPNASITPASNPFSAFLR